MHCMNVHKTIKVTRPRPRRYIFKTETRPRRSTFKTETTRDVPKNVSRPRLETETFKTETTSLIQSSLTLLPCGTCRRKLIERAIIAEQQRQVAEEQQQAAPFTVIGAIRPISNGGLYEEIDMHDACGYSVPNFRKSQLQNPHDGYEPIAVPPPPVPERPEQCNACTDEPDFFHPGNEYTPQPPDKHVYSRSLPTDDGRI